jgi:hypothetical protein
MNPFKRLRQLLDTPPLRGDGGGPAPDLRDYPFTKPARRSDRRAGPSARRP